MNILYIDTSDNTMTRIRLDVGNTVLEKTSDSRVLKSQMTLPLIESMLKESGLLLSDISEIRVATGPGSFTGVRVGISIANTISTLCGIPVNGKHDLAKALYEPYNEK